MTVSVSVDADLLELLVTHVSQHVQSDLMEKGHTVTNTKKLCTRRNKVERCLCLSHLFSLEDVPQVFKPQTLQEL